MQIISLHCHLLPEMKLLVIIISYEKETEKINCTFL